MVDMPMDKKQLSEQDIRSKFILPAILKSGWDLMRQVREEEAITVGQIMVRGKTYTRKKNKKADYILYYKPNIPIAVIEAKSNIHPVGTGMQQALEYAEMMDVPFVYTSNGDGFLEHDCTVSSGPIEKELSLDAFPSPDLLWKRYKIYKGIPDSAEKIVTQDYYGEDENKKPHYYQMTAINRTIEAIAKGQKRILLVMATGTGKTFVAFQVIWRLWKARKMKRVLFLADRDNLISQTMTNDFKPFGDKMKRIENRSANKAFEVYLALYQAITGPEERQKTYKQFKPDFFDLIVVDECHRGSAAEDSQWREILEYFSNATQIGLTATPKETKYVSNISYFGEPVFLYSLKQGILDGFLAPYKVIRVVMDKDDGWRPPLGKKDKDGELVPDRIYNLTDYDRELVIDERTETVARRITEFLKSTGRFDKTIVFCEDIDHAARMRCALVNQNPDMVSINRKYIVQITGEEPERRGDLDSFITPSETYPVIATTSKLMGTGVDSRTCKLIVIDKTINSMIEFKQIIGRGTRVVEEYNKLYFTIIDFRRATNLFADPDFDGEPVSVYESHYDDIINTHDGPWVICQPTPVYGEKKIYVNGVPVNIIHERVQYMDADGKLITESIRDFSRKVICYDYSSLDDFLARWSEAEKKQAVIEELERHGLFLDALQGEVGKDFDVFDLVCHIAFDRKPLTRRERADHVKKQDYFEKYGEKARAVLDALLDKYADQGLMNIEDIAVLKIHPFDSMGTFKEILDLFGGKTNYLNAVKELTARLYGYDAA